MPTEVKICRLCLKYTEDEIPVDCKMTVIKALKDIYRIQLYDAKSEYPRLVCQTCVSKIVDFYEYYTETMANQTKLYLGFDNDLIVKPMAIKKKESVIILSADTSEDSLANRPEVPQQNETNIENDNNCNNYEVKRLDTPESKQSEAYVPRFCLNPVAKVAATSNSKSNAGSPSKRPMNFKEMNNNSKVLPPKRLCFSSTNPEVTADPEQLLIETIDLISPHVSQESIQSSSQFESEFNPASQESTISKDDPSDSDYVPSTLTQSSKTSTVEDIPESSSEASSSNQSTKSSSVNINRPLRSGHQSDSSATVHSCESDVEITATYRIPRKYLQPSITNFFKFKKEILYAIEHQSKPSNS